MQKIEQLGDLERYGIVPLTGDACGLMYRVLFDLTAKGKQIVEKCFSVEAIDLHLPWNTGTPEVPHVGSIMLFPEALTALGIFALMESGCTEVWQKGNSLFGIEATDSATQLELFKRTHGPMRRFAYRGTAGDRNVHQATGRVT